MNVASLTHVLRQRMLVAVSSGSLWPHDSARLLLCVAVALLLLQCCRSRARSRDLNKIPLGPGCIPVLGHLDVLQALRAQKIHEYFTRFTRDADAGVLRFTVLGETRLVLCAPHTIAAALNKATFLPKPAGLYNAFYMLGIKQPNLPLLSDEQEHKRVRGHMMKFFHSDNIARIIGQLTQEVRTTLAAIDSASAAPIAPQPHGTPVGLPESHETPSAHQANLPGAPDAGIYAGGAQGVLVDASAMAKGNVMRVVFRVFLETDSYAPFETVYDAMAHVTEVSGHPLHFTLLKWGLLPGYSRYRRNWKKLHDYHCRLAREAYARPMPEGSTAFWASVRRAFPNALTDKREFEAAAANLNLYLIAYETTANAITHTLAALALDQDSQIAVEQELHKAGLLGTAENPEPHAIERADLADLKMLDAVVHESLRLMAPAPVGGLRELARDTKIGGFVVPKGTGLIVPPCALHASTAAWGPDADKWRPGRWLEGKSLAAVKLTPEGHPRFLPFFAGPSNCIGQHLAMVEIKLVVASLLSRLHISMDPQRMAHMRTVEDYAASTVVSVVLQSNGPCWLRMRRRAPASAA